MLERNQTVTVRSDIKEYVGEYLGGLYVNEEMAKQSGLKFIVSFVSKYQFVPCCNLVGANYYWTPEMFEETKLE